MAACYSSIHGKYLAPVDWLAAKISDDSNWRDAFQTAIDNARKHNVEAMKSIKTIADYLDHIDCVLRRPFAGHVSSELLQRRWVLYFIANQPPLKTWQSPVYPTGKHQELTELSEWIVRYAQSVGMYMDNPESAQDIKKFKEGISCDMGDYMDPPSGYLTMNQFFARHVKPGTRPIVALNDDSVIVSPADSTFMGWWRISSESKINAEPLLDIKGLQWSIHQLLEGSEYEDAFAGGIFAHCFLKAHNYHRFHTPVAGTVLEKKNIQGQCYLELRMKESPDGKRVLEFVNGMGYQFVQTRGLIVIDSPIGLVACIPVGMGQVSSVVLTADKGVYLHKGEELGYFQYGGSDIVMLFQEKANVELFCKSNIEYKVRTAIGKAGGFLEN